jgi:tetratricopeptide (TPR) repeat protein
MSHRFQHFLFSGLIALCVGVSSPGQQTKDSKAQTKQQKESEPPEEDDAAKPTEYAFNPLQAEHELKVGEFYLKKGSYAAAVARFTEATKWNPTMAEAFLRLGEAAEKFKDRKMAKDAYSKYVELAPDAKNTAEIKKKLQKM